MCFLTFRSNCVFNNGTSANILAPVRANIYCLNSSRYRLA